MGNQVNQKLILEVQTKLSDAGRAFKDLAQQGEQANKRIGKAAADAEKQQAKVAQSVGKDSASFLAGAVKFGAAVQVGTSAVNALAIAFNSSIPAAQKLESVIRSLPFGLGALGQAFLDLGREVSGAAGAAREAEQIRREGGARAGAAGTTAEAERRIAELAAERARLGDQARGLSPVQSASAEIARIQAALSRARQRAADAGALRTIGQAELGRLQTPTTLGRGVTVPTASPQAIAAVQARIAEQTAIETAELRNIEIQLERLQRAQVELGQRRLEQVREQAAIERDRLGSDNAAGTARLETNVRALEARIRQDTFREFSAVSEQIARFIREEARRASQEVFREARANQPRP